MQLAARRAATAAAPDAAAACVVCMEVCQRAEGGTCDGSAAHLVCAGCA